MPAGDVTDSSGDSGGMSAITDVLDLHPLLPGETSFSSCRHSAGEAAADAALATLAGPWHLAVLDGPDRGLVIAVRDGAFLGRGEVLSDPLVSRRHLRLRIHGGRVLAQDCGSANGSYRYWHLGLWWRARREMRLREGTLLRLGGSVLELRRRPCDLVVAAPAAPASSAAWLMVGSLVCLLVMGCSAAVAVRTGSRGAMGMVMVAPMVAMTIMRLVPFLQRRRSQRTGRAGGPRWRGRRRRRGRRPGWRHGEPDPATMLLAVAARSSMSQSVQSSEAEGSTPVSTSQEVLAAWSAGRRRRCVLSLSDGESLALVGEGAGNVLRWWCTQLLARDEVQLTVLTDLPGDPRDERTGRQDSGEHSQEHEECEEEGGRLGVRLRRHVLTARR